MISRKIY